MQINIEYGKVSDLIYTLLTQTKARKFRAGFVKKQIKIFFRTPFDQLKNL